MSPETWRLAWQVADMLLSPILADISVYSDRNTSRSKDIINQLFEDCLIPIAAQIDQMEWPDKYSVQHPLLKVEIQASDSKSAPLEFKLLSFYTDIRFVTISVGALGPRRLDMVDSVVACLRALILIIINNWMEGSLLSDHFSAYPQPKNMDSLTGSAKSGRISVFAGYFLSRGAGQSSRSFIKYLAEYEKWRAAVIRPLLLAFSGCNDYDGDSAKLTGGYEDIFDKWPVDLTAENIPAILQQLKSNNFSLSPFCNYPIPFLISRLVGTASPQPANIEQIKAPFFGPPFMRRAHNSPNSSLPRSNESGNCKIKIGDRRSMLSLRRPRLDKFRYPNSCQKFRVLFTRSTVENNGKALSKPPSHAAPVKGTSRGCFNSPCLIQYRDFEAYNFGDSDQSLADFIRMYLLQAAEICQSTSNSAARCGLPMDCHYCAFTHGSGRIHVRFEQPCVDLIDFDTVLDIDEEGFGVYDERPIWLWSECELCAQSTSKVQLSSRASNYSFVKYLELLLYNPFFSVHATNLCRPPLHRLHIPQSLSGNYVFGRLSGQAGKEADELLMNWGLNGAHPAHRNHIKRFFQLGDRCLSFRFESIALFELSLPGSDASLAEAGETIDHILNPPLISMTRYPGGLFSRPSSHSVREALEFYWETVDHYINAWQDALQEKQKLQQKSFKNWIISRVESDASCTDFGRILESLEIFKKQLLRERLHIDSNIIPLIHHEFDRIDRFQQRKSLAGPQLMDIEKAAWSLPISALQNVRRTLASKLECIDREMAYFRLQLLQQPGAKQLRLDEYYRHPGIRSLSSLGGGKVQWEERYPCSLVAYAMASVITRDLLSVLGEAHELARFLSPNNHENAELNCSAPDDLEVDDRRAHDLPSGSQQKPSDGYGNFVTQQLVTVQKILSSGRYPTSFSSPSKDMQYSYRATIIDSAHILFQCFDSKPEADEGNSRDFSNRKDRNYEKSPVWSVTIHFAYYFESLRCKSSIKPCDYLQSLAHTESWQPTGGKSASRFFQTTDGRFIVKQVGLKRNWWSALWPKRNFDSAPSGSSTPTPLTDDHIVVNEDESRSILAMLLKYLEYFLFEIKDEASLIVKTHGSYKISINKRLDRCDNENDSLADLNFNMHLLIMDNLFFGRPEISRKFDLKGITSRGVKMECDASIPKNLQGEKSGSRLASIFKIATQKPRSAVNSSTASRPETPTSITLLDANWVQSLHQPLDEQASDAGTPISLPLSMGQTLPKTLLFLHPHSKYLLKTTIACDTAFLSSANIIDYSLLVGVDSDSGELVVGLVDYLVEYDGWKLLENKGKTTIRALEDTVLACKTTTTRVENVTIQPPERYRQRFLKAMDKYFLEVPDKWATNSSVDSAAAASSSITSIIQTKIM